MKEHVLKFDAFVDSLNEAKINEAEDIMKLQKDLFEDLTLEEILTLDEKELSPAQKNFQDLMFAALKKFDVESPADLDEEGKKKFFTWLGDNWKKGEGEATEDGKKEVEKQGTKGKADKNSD